MENKGHKKLWLKVIYEKWYKKREPGTELELGFFFSKKKKYLFSHVISPEVSNLRNT